MIATIASVFIITVFCPVCVILSCIIAEDDDRSKFGRFRQD